MPVPRLPHTWSCVPVAYGLCCTLACVAAGTFNTMSDPRFVGIVRDTVKSKLDELVHIAANLTETCYRMYTTTKSGESPGCATPDVCTVHRHVEFRPSFGVPLRKCTQFEFALCGCCVAGITPGLAPEIVTFHPGGDFRPNRCV
jgi:hypothetical protein